MWEKGKFEADMTLLAQPVKETEGKKRRGGGENVEKESKVHPRRFASTLTRF